MVTHLFSTIHLFTPETTFHFLLNFYKAYLPFLQGTEMQTNKMPLAIYIDFPKFSFNFTLKRKHLLNLSSAILKSDWDMSRVVCQPTKQRKSVAIVEIYESWLATNNVIHRQILWVFCIFLAKYNKNERKKWLNWHRGFMLPFSQFGIHLQMDFWTLSIMFWSTTTILWP